MRKYQKRIVSRIIAKIFYITQNEGIRLKLVNFSTKIFVDWKNSVEYDSFNKLFWLKSGKEYLLPVDHPYFNFHKIFLEARFINIFCRQYTPLRGDIVVNLGAGVGEELISFQNRIKSEGKLYNIEASPSTFRKLDILSKKNNFSNCYNYNCAITNIIGEIWIKENIHYLRSKTNLNNIGMTIPSYSLDKFVEDQKILTIDYLKVNIEGAEYDMIDGMKDSIKIIKNIAISCHDFLSKNEDYRIMNKVKKFLIANNFEVIQRYTGNEILDSWVYGAQRSDNNQSL